MPPDSPLNETGELLRLAKDGDDGARETLLARYLPRLQRWASGRLPAWARSLVDTSDVVQDVFLRTLQGLDRVEVRGPGIFQAYVRRAVLNRIRDEVRWASRRPGPDGVPEDLAAHGPTPLEQAITADTLARYEEALALQTTPTDKQQTIRTLMTLSLDAKDWPKAKEYHEKLLKLDANNLFVRAELGRELFSRGEYERAESELKEVVTHAAGDNRTLAPALKDLGKAQAKAHKNQDALATLKKALQAAGSEAAVRAEIYETITEIYRADQQLPMLIKQLEDEHPTDFARLALLGGLYEETGDVEKAIATLVKPIA